MFSYCPCSTYTHLELLVSLGGSERHDGGDLSSLNVSTKYKYLACDSPSALVGRSPQFNTSHVQPVPLHPHIRKHHSMTLPP